MTIHKETDVWCPNVEGDHARFFMNLVGATCREVAKKAPLIQVFVNTETGNCAGPDRNFRDFERACAEVGAHIVHVPRRNGRDDVDRQIIRTMQWLEPQLQDGCAFLLFSEDKDYADACMTLKDRCSVYLGLGSTKFIPRFAKGGDRHVRGSLWTDNSVHLHRAMYFLCSKEDNSRFRDYIHGCGRRSMTSEFSAFPEVRAAVNAVMRAGASSEAVLDRGERDFQAAAWIHRTARAAGAGITLEQAQRLLKYMMHYEVFVEDPESIMLDTSHPRVVELMNRKSASRPPAKGSKSRPRTGDRRARNTGAGVVTLGDVWPKRAHGNS